VKTNKNYQIGLNCKGLRTRDTPHGIDGKTHNDCLILDGTFKAACEKAGIPPTKRQMSKYRQGRGLARLVQRGGQP
jgi:hypothetical protein